MVWGVRSAAKRHGLSVVVLSFFVSLFSLTLPISYTSAADVVGTVSGKLSVSPSGTAGYSIPIVVPVGTTGVQPKVGLNYNSRAGNGMLGVGWSITGLSAVTRCATDRYFDNPANGGIGIDPVDFDDNDKFCLDGQRLVAVNGAYGADGTEYRTAFASFSKIIGYGAGPEGPTHFKVWRKSGEIYEYGVDANAREQRKTQNHVRTWHLNKILDVKGNYVSFTYHNDRTAGEFWITRIDYTGNDAQGLAPYNHVEFVYEARTDIVKGFYAGDAVNRNKRLKNVKVYADGTLFQDYQLTYEMGSTNRSRITAIKQCATNGDCFKPTTFAWSQGNTSGDVFEKVEILASEAMPDKYRVFGSGDFNGDGLTDMYLNFAFNDGNSAGYPAAHARPGYVWLSKGDGTFDKITIPASEAMPDKYRVFGSGDFNGDGLTDMYLNFAFNDGRSAGYPAAHARPGYVWLSKGDGTFDKITIPASEAMPDKYRVFGSGDFNGDGLTDMYLNFAFNDGNSAGYPAAHARPGYVWLSKGDGTFDKITIPASEAMPDKYRVFGSGDFNGDGLTDMYLNFAFNDGNSAGYPAAHARPGYVWLSKGDGTFDKITIPASEAMPDKYRVFGSGDFNGDGLTDMYLNFAFNDGNSAGYPAAHARPGYVWLSKGDGTFDKITIPASEAMPDKYRVFGSGDFNGDGLTDMYLNFAFNDGNSAGYPAAHARPGYVWLSKGDGTFDKITIPASEAMPDKYRVFGSGDFNGDGLTDMYLNFAFNDGNSAGYPAAHARPGYVWLSKGDGTFDKITIPASEAMPDKYRVFGSGDFNGDGLTDMYLNFAFNDGRSAGYPAAHARPGYVWLSKPPLPDEIVSITNGHGLTTDITYKSMTDDTVYTKGTGAQYPLQDIIASGRVVSEVKANNGIGGQNSQSYTYEGLRTHINGFGNLGFEKMTMTDGETGIRTVSTYSQDWANHHQGLLIDEKVITPSEVVMSEKTVSWDVRLLNDPGSEPYCFRFSPQSVTVRRDLNGAFLGRTIKQSTFDDYSFATQSIVTVESEDGSVQHTKITNNVYNHDVANWRLGQLSSASVTHQETGKADKVRTSSFTYDSDGMLLSQTFEPGSALEFIKTNAYNNFGAITSVTETWGSQGDDGIVATSRTSSFTYDARVRYKLTETNALGHTQTNTYQAVHGNLLTSTGPNGLTTTFEYDDFGRRTKEIRADGSTTISSREFCDGSFSCPTNAVFRVRVVEASGAEQEVFFNKINKELRKQSKLAGQWSLVDTVYDSQSRIVQKSEPYFVGDNIYWTTITYDLLGRPTNTLRPDNTTQLMSYNGLTHISTNEAGQTKTIVKDIAGRQTTVTDNLGQVITYNYNALDQVTSMVADGKTQSFTYDIRGNKITDTDPDKGTWSYRYNALGLIVEQTNSKSQMTAMTYDVLGRMLTRIDDVGAANPGERTATWVYDTATMGLGKLHTVSQQGYVVTNSYDSLGRPSSTSEQIDTTTFTTSTTYDAFSRPLTVSYPTQQGLSPLTLKNVYDANGALQQVEENGTAHKYWERLEVDARGNVTKSLLGNGVETFKIFTPEVGRLTDISSTKGTSLVQDLRYTFDDVGNLTLREDRKTNQIETFGYDGLNRLLQVSTTVGGNTTLTTMTYSATGNILSKSDIGTYVYGEAHSACSSGFAGPHALTSVSGTKNATYCYDANGNMTSGDGRTISYSAFDKPVQIVKGANTVSLTYGPDRKRYKRVDQTSAGMKTTLYLAGKSYETMTDSNGNVTEKHYIGDFAIVTRTSPLIGTGTLRTNYVHRDHLGSVDAITDETGVVEQRMSFDAWGKRRETNWAPLSETAIASFNTSLTTRGFTGHEQLDPVGLVHMNGRVYDAELGRFLSADPHVQATHNLQNWNRYSYVLNNPLSYTDPTGFFFKKLFKAIGKFFKKVFKAIGRVLKKILRSPIIRGIIQIVGCALGGPIGCAAVSAGITAATGGSIGDIIQAAFFAYVMPNVWGAVARATSTLSIIGKALVHGVVNGAVTAARGGRFLAGFASGVLGKIAGFASQSLFGPAGSDNGMFFARTAVAAAAGCAGAVIAKGSCTNGAVTAAFAHMFNAESIKTKIGCLGGGGGGDIITGCLSGGGGGWGAGGGAVRSIFGRGRASEKRVLEDLGLKKNNKKVETSEGKSIPDSLSPKKSVEIKDCITVSCTKQLRIQTEAAKQSGRDSVLITGEKTHITGPTKEAFDTIIRRKDLGPK